MSLREKLSQLGFEPEQEFIAAYRQLEPEGQAGLLIRLLALLETSDSPQAGQAHEDDLSQFLTRIETQK